MIRSHSVPLPPAPAQSIRSAAGPAASPAAREAADRWPPAREWLGLAMGGWSPMSGGLTLESLFDRLEGRA